MSIRRLRVARVTHLPSTPEKENRQAMKKSSPVPQSMRTLRNVTDACNDATEKSVVSCWRNPTFRFISDPTRAPEDTPRTGLRQAFSRPRPTRRWEAFRAPLEKRSPLDPIVREGTQQIRQAASHAEVNAFRTAHAEQRDEHGKVRALRNRFQPTREMRTCAGRLDVRKTRARDQSPELAPRVIFSSSVLPPYV
jgi:hypothetical protein